MNHYIKGQDEDFCVQCLEEAGEYEPWLSGIDNSPMTWREYQDYKGWLIFRQGRFSYTVTHDGSMKNWAMTAWGARRILRKEQSKLPKRPHWESPVMYREDDDE